MALATLCSFFDACKTIDYSLKADDLNIDAYTRSGESINTTVYPVLFEETIKSTRYDVLALSAMSIFKDESNQPSYFPEV